MAARPFRIGILVIVAFAAGLFLARLFTPTPIAPPSTERATVLPDPRKLPQLDLVDQDGRPLPPDFFASHWTLVFFGFTQCPDICPTPLATLAQATRQLADLPEAERPRVLLVSVDPERDPPERLAPRQRRERSSPLRYQQAQKNRSFRPVTTSGEERWGVQFSHLPGKEWQTGK